MSRYIKRIEQFSTGMVVAEVYRASDNHRVGYAFFHWPPFSQKRRLLNAHKWADRWIENCERYEVMP